MASEARNQEEGNQRPELSPSPVAEALIPDPAQPPPDTTVLQGILGRSDKEGYWRVYFSSSLKEYVEFKAEDALYSDPISKEESSLGVEATRVWLKQEARIMYPYGYPYGHPGFAPAGRPRGPVFDPAGRPAPVWPDPVWPDPVDPWWSPTPWTVAPARWNPRLVVDRAGQPPPGWVGPDPWTLLL